ncbi:hypothetical protein GCM10022236_09360 [Microlunatus ginsengisoli]|uniref:Uncharacterized protein n=1 Tax=Microlunatus ginsengisoli TaxID=363863 RepID=A0ABP6ZLF5_9ACTN
MLAPSDQHRVDPGLLQGAADAAADRAGPDHHISRHAFDPRRSRAPPRLAVMSVFPLLLVAGIALLGVLAIAAVIVIVVRAGAERM